MKNELKFYKLPFIDTGELGLVIDANDTPVFAFMGNPSEAHVNKILKSINSETHEPIVGTSPVKFGYIKSRKVIDLNMKDFILLRGWYDLTGKDKHNLSYGMAAEIQEHLVKYMLEKLNA